MNKTRILIIEDEEPIAALISYGLTMEGFHPIQKHRDCGGGEGS